MKLLKLVKISLILGFSGLTQTVLAQSTNDKNQQVELNAVVDAGTKINTSASNSQLRVDDISASIQSKLQQFKTVNKEVDGLHVYNQQMQKQIDNQFKELNQLALSMEQVSIIERQVSPLMARMIDTLEAFVALDVPFLYQERTERINDLKAMLEQADVAVSEKFRRVLEAYQIEVDYGRTIEAYSGLLDVKGSDRDVDFLRIGRVSYVYQTRDGQQMGLWDQSDKNWQDLPAKYRLDINKGLRIARKQLAPDLIIVPVAQTSAE